ncbi:putative porin [Acinetobacter silvestris]|uniref:Putative porin n=1 Tax=Acinetobacter silvestris TaxID=1977882 RepID=A0A1Y3CDM0_9GAMM|nr:putative porin [Acinetobacter silvestris]OTG64225.1 putative porin [Acinetobacter silvestris]
MKKLAIATALFSTLAVAGTANAYQAEVGGTINVIDPDHANTTTGFGIDGTYYFNPVQVKDAPLNEAGFLNRASNVKANVAYSDNDDLKITTFGGGVEYFVPNTDFYASAGIQHAKAEFHDFDTKTTSYNAEVGYLPVPGLLIAAGIVGVDQKDGDNNVDPAIRAKYVTKVGQYDMNFEAATSFGDVDYYNLGADLYLDKTFSVGAGYSGTNGDLNDEDVFSIRAKKFFNQQVSLEGSVGFGDNYNTYGVRGAYRF